MALVLAPSNLTATSKQLAFDNDDACSMNVFFRFVDGKVRCVGYYIIALQFYQSTTSLDAPSPQHISVQYCVMPFYSIRSDDLMELQ
jgi:hypothetical protein